MVRVEVGIMSGFPDQLIVLLSALLWCALTLEARVTSHKIRFENIEVADGLRIDMDCVIEDAESGLTRFPLWFAFNRPVFLTEDSIATALSTLCGKAYSEVHMDLAPSARTIDYLRTFTGSTVTTKGTKEHPVAPRAGQALSFSGGFDSMAALALMPDDTNLVSMDFGGRFSRERTFFEQFDTTIVSSNLLETELRKNSWSFMGSGAILTSAHTRAEYHTFGSILEAGVDNLNMDPVASRNETFPAFAEAGYTNAPYVAGLTEIGTLIVMAHYKRDQISDSLISLASPGEEKLYRKKVLADVVSARFGTNLDIPEVQKPSKPHFTFGQNFALDFLAFYVAKHAGEDIVNELVSDVPAELVRLASGLDLTFFERANPSLYLNFPTPLLAGVTGRLADAGMRFYVEQDWRDLSRVRQFLEPYYPIIKSSHSFDGI